MEIRQIIVIRHSTIVWMIGLVTGIALTGLHTRFEGILGVFIGGLLVFVSKNFVNAYRQWAEILPEESSKTE